MKRTLFASILLMWWLPLLAVAQQAAAVDPFIGTARSHAPTLWGNHGGTYPGAVAPWGRVQLTPETSIRPTEKGYYYTDSRIRSFSCIEHRSGYPNGSTGALHLAFLGGRVDEIPPGYDGRPFSHLHEAAEPGYYSVRFDDATDRVEATARERSGLFRYTPAAGGFTLVVCHAGPLSVETDSTLQAARLHALIQCSTPWDACLVRNDTAFLFFRQRHTPLLVKVGTSTHSYDGSRKNLEAELPGWDFEAVRRRVYRQWDDELSCVVLDTGTRHQRTTFYTALYHAFLMPWIISDVDGRYHGGECTAPGEDAYGEFSTWDTFRSLHPLLSLLQPERQRQMVRSVIDAYRQQGVVPRGPMTGMHTIAVVVDAYVKGTTSEAADTLYRALQSLYRQPDLQPSLHPYLSNGYLDASLEQSVSITTEYAYNDWVMGHFARLTGRPADAAPYFARSFNYRHLFDEATGFLLPREAGGFLQHAGELGYQESNRWTASYFAPHNVRDLINLAGGDDAFVSQLREGYRLGMIPHDNEPVFHYPYLFTFAGRPDLTAQVVRKILGEDYSSRPGGIPGNDDLGSTSSWFVLSALGLYPACPGTDQYLLTPPLFDSLRIRPPHGKEIRLTATGRTPGREAVYPSLTVRGADWKKLFITHGELMAGGELTYHYDRPLACFDAFDRPYSATCESPAFTVGSTAPALARIYPGQTNRVVFSVSNAGATGSYVAQLYAGDVCLASRRVLVEQGQTRTDSLPFTLYAAGSHTLRLGQATYRVTVADSAHYAQPLLCTAISLPPLLPLGGAPAMGSFGCMNRTGATVHDRVAVVVDGEPIALHAVSLAAGKDTVIPFPFSPKRAGFAQVRVLNASKRVKAYRTPLETCLLELTYEAQDTACITDHSGFGNHGTLVGLRQPARRGTLRLDEQSYVVFPLSESLQSVATNQLTLSTWIYPLKAPGGQADFFTKGDYSLLKMDGAHRLAFFAGGWGRGECQVRVPDNWYTAWHHLAGVCTGDTLRLYIDGVRVQEIPVEGVLSPTELPWMLGRNAEMPYARFSDMQFGATRIYGSALSDEEVALLFARDKHEFKE